MSDAVLVAIISGCFSIIGYLIGNYKSQSKTLYRIEQLEIKQDKHNTLIERMYKAEENIDLIQSDIKVANHRIKDLERKSEQ